MAKTKTYDETQRRRTHFKIFYGTFDFLGVIACTLCILALLALLTSMLSWFRQDVAQTFSSLTSRIYGTVQGGGTQ